jgi:hypothetical protein
MTARSAKHRYVDPLDHLWLATAQKLGLNVRRSTEVYAATDGRETLTIANADALDPDDCLAQMIFHEICHWLTEGEDAADKPDWGLDNMTDRAVPREHACLRLQAFLAARHGLRQVLAPTTDFRSFYDSLGDDPLEPRRDPTAVIARQAARRADKPPWAPHLEAALAATARIAEAAGEFQPRSRAGLPELWQLVTPPVALHPGGLRTRINGGESCGTCAWRDDATGNCRQIEAVADNHWPGCERWEPVLDCLECGACCRAAYHSVTVLDSDPVIELHPELIIEQDTFIELKRDDDRCAALEGGHSADQPYECSIYGGRPQPCRDFERGGEHCLTARRRVGLSL